MRDIIFHAFQWRIKDIITNLSSIKNAGYTAIQISPMQGVKNEDFSWYWLYQPLGLRIIDSYIGTKDDLKELCTEALKYNIKIVLDVVLRHVAGKDDGELKPHEKVDKEIRDNSTLFTNARNNTGDLCRYNIIHDAFGMPMLDYNNIEVQEMYKNFLNEIKECGVTGIRIDMGKHFGLREEGCTFWENVIDGCELERYSECIDCDTELLNKYSRHTKILSNNKCSDLSKMVLFIMTHDTELEWHSTCNKNNDDIIRDWKYMINTYNNSDMLFFPRPFDNLWKSEIISKINKT